MSVLPFDLWYVPALPLDSFTVEYGAGAPPEHPDRASWVDSVAASIQEHGLVNPLLILNHEGRPRPRLKCGKNRWLALRQRGWTHAPAIVTGECPVPFGEARPTTLEYANRYLIKDGLLEPSGQGLRMTGNTHPSDL